MKEYFVTEKPIYFSGFDQFHLNCDCISGTILNGKILAYINCQKKTVKKLKKKQENILTKSNISDKRFFFEDDGNRKIDYIGETITFCLQLKTKTYKHEKKHVST